MNNPFSLEGKTILVTGASSGIGRGVCVDCAKMGAKVHLTARNEERLNETLSQMEGEGHVIHQADLCSTDDILALVDSLPTIDGVVLCAGIIKTMPVKNISEDAMTEIFNANNVGFGVRACAVDINALLSCFSFDALDSCLPVRRLEALDNDFEVTSVCCCECAEAQDHAECECDCQDLFHFYFLH